jgi:nitroreductase
MNRHLAFHCRREPRYAAAAWRIGENWTLYHIAQAPLAIVVAIERTMFSISDASRAIESMVLAAWSEGLGSNWVGFRGLDEVKSLLSIPDELDVLAIIPFGYPAQPIGKGKKKRKSISEVAHLERFGRPFE